MVLNGNTMGTYYSIILPDSYSKETITSFSVDIDSLLNRINTIASTYIDDSELMALNNYRSKNFKSISEELYFLIEKSLLFYGISNGYYDVTVSPLVNLWGFGKNGEIIAIPSSVSIDSIKSFVGSDKIILNTDKTISKLHPLLEIDLSSIAKGYAVDIISKYLSDLGVNNFLVDIGGEIYASGLNNNKVWEIGIRNPIDLGLIHSFEVTDRAIATSGTYINFKSVDSNLYPHIISPISGMPVPNSIISCTVVTDSCTDADAIATMIIALGKEKMLSTLETLEKVEYYIIVHTEKGLEIISNFD